MHCAFRFSAPCFLVLTALAFGAPQTGAFVFHAWTQQAESHGACLVIDNVSGQTFTGYMDADWDITNGSHDGTNVSYTGFSHLWGDYSANYTGKDGFGCAGVYPDGVTVLQGHSSGWLGTFTQHLLSAEHGNSTRILTIATAAKGTLAGTYATGEAFTGTYNNSDGTFTLTVPAWAVTYSGLSGDGWAGTYIDNWGQQGVFLNLEFRPGANDVRIDAIDCRLKTAGERHDTTGWALEGTGYLETMVRTNTAGTITVTLLADGQGSAGTLPEMTLRLGNDSVTWDTALWTVADHGSPHTTYSSYSRSFNLDRGTYPVRIELANPASDRRLYVKHISFSGQRVTPINSQESLTATRGYFKPFRNGTDNPLWLKDFSFFRHAGYTYVCASQKPFGNEGAYLARSVDLYHWEPLGAAVATRTPECADELWAPHVIEADGVYYMFYTGITRPQPGIANQKICVASTATPGIASSWQRNQNIQFVVDGQSQSWFRPDHPGHEWQPNQWADCRDAMVMQHAGQWHMFYTATDVGNVIVGVATAPDILGPWSDQGAVLTAELGTALESVFIIEDPDGGFVMVTNHTSGNGHIKTARGTSLTPVNGQPSFGDLRPIADTTRPPLSGWAHEFLPGPTPGTYQAASLANHDYVYFIQFMDAYLIEESFGWTMTADPEPIVNVPPTFADAYLSPDTIVADHVTHYRVTSITEDDNGAENIRDTRVMFNVDFVNPSNARGYLCWGATPEDVTHYEDDWDVFPAEGGGYYGIHNAGWGHTYINPVHCVTRNDGTRRTVTWTFTASSDWVSNGPADGNFIGLHARDAQDDTSGWLRSDEEFGYTFGVRAAGTNLPPLFHDCTLTPTTLVADGTAGYDLALTVEDPNGLNQIRDLRIMLNRDFMTPANVRGYLGWGQSPAELEYYGNLTTIGPAAGGGYWGYDTDEWGHAYIAPLACSTTTIGNQRTVTWTFAVCPLWATEGPHLGNVVGMFSRDAITSSGWRDADAMFGWTFAVVAYAGPADLDRDGDIDGDDLTILAGCDSGPAIPHNGSAPCVASDLDDDSDVDQLDFGLLQKGFTASEDPAPGD